MDSMTNEEFANQLRAAYIKGPREEVCRAVDGDCQQSRQFSAEEESLLGIKDVLLPEESDRSIDLYGKSVPGWKMVFKK